MLNGFTASPLRSLQSMSVSSFFDSPVLSVSGGRDLCSHTPGIAPTYNAIQCDSIEVRGVPKPLRVAVPYPQRILRRNFYSPAGRLLTNTQDNVMLVSKRITKSPFCFFLLTYRP